MGDGINYAGTKGGAEMKGKSLRQLAKELGVSASYLSQVRKGKRPPSKKVLSIFGGSVKQNSKANQIQKVKQSVKQVVKQEINSRSEAPGARTLNRLIKSQLLYLLS